MIAERVIFLPGMGATHELAAPQRSLLPSLEVPPWIPPHRRETLASYAARFAATLSRQPPDWIIGVSFGGFLALELAPLVRPRGVVLVASSTSVAGRAR